MSEKPTGSIVGGSVLIAVGLGLLAMQFFGGIGGSVVVPLLGVAFLVGYGFLGVYGLLIPGGIMTGLGAGIVAVDSFGAPGGVVVLGLGLGFLGIYLVDRVRSRQNRWWPLIPGSILVIIGGGSSIASVRDIIAMYWPLIPVVIGVLIIVKAVREKRATPSDPGAPPS